MNFDDLKAKYGEFCDSLAEKGVPQPRLLLPLLAIVVLVGIAILAYPAVTGGEAKTITLRAVDAKTNAAIANAIITLYADGTEFKSAATDASGRAAFEGVKGQAFQVSVQADGYEAINKRVIDPETPTLSLNSIVPASKDVVIKVRDVQGNALDGAQVMLLFDGGDAKTGTTNAWGELTVNVPEPAEVVHATVRVEKNGYASGEKSVYSTDFDSVLNVELQPAAEQTRQEEGMANVVVKDSRGTPLQGVIVTLVDYYNDRAVRSGATDASGSFAVGGLTIAQKLRVTARDPADGYLAYSSQDYLTASATPAPFNVRMESREADANAIDITVTNDQLAALEGASVRVYDRLTAKLLTEERTDAYGTAAIQVARNKAFYVTAYADGYLPLADDSLKAGDKKKFALTREKSGNYVDLQVQAKSAATLEALPNAGVELYQSNGFPLGTPTAETGADGIALVRVPSQLNGRQYSVYAIATRDYWVGRSDAVTVTEGAELYALMQPTPATIQVKAKDIVTSEPIDGAKIYLVASGATLASCTATKANDACTFQVAPEQEFWLESTAEGYLEAATVTKIAAPGEAMAAEVYLYPLSLSQSAALRLEGIYDSNGNEVRELSNAQEYEARFVATVPSSGTTATRAFFKLGGKPTVDEEQMGFTGLDCPSCAGFENGAYYDESCGAAGQNADATQGEGGLSKWYSLMLPDGFTGTQEIILRFWVKPSAKAGTETELEYNLHGFKNGVPFLAPQDEAILDKVLGNGTQGESDFCGAKTFGESVKVSQDPLVCADGACVRLSLESSDGSVRAKNSFQVPAGKEFYLNYEVLSLDTPVAGFELAAPEQVEIVSWSAASLASQHAQALGVGERASGRVRLLALRAADYALLQFNVNFQDPAAPAMSTPLTLQITGANTFRVVITPDSLVAGLSENSRVTVLDQFDRPVTDATVTFFECEGSPLNGQELDVVGENQRNYGEDGKYLARLNPSSMGAISVRVARAGFKAYEDCMLPVYAGDFLTVEPSVVDMKGSSANPAALARQVTLSTLLPIDSRVSTAVACYKPGEATPIDSVVYAAPQSFTLKDDATVQIYPKENATAKADCYLTFLARANNKNKAEQTVLVNVDLQGPGLPPCPSPYSCLTASAASERGCNAVDAYACPATAVGLPAQGCYACEIGATTLPGSISLTVSNTKPTDTVEYLISLGTAPEECRVEGFEFTPTLLPQQQYQQQYPNIQSNYWGYQPNAYSQQNPWGTTDAYSLNGYYGYLNGMSLYGGGAQTPYGAAGYNSQTGAYGSAGYGGFGTAANCPTTLNPQSMYGSYMSNSMTSPWQQGFPTGMPTQCQYPYVCSNPNACSYSTMPGLAYGSTYSAACQYPAICNAPQSCPYVSGSTNYQVPYAAGTSGAYQNPAYQQTNYQQNPTNYQSSQKPPVKVRIDACTPNDLQITAEYTGADYLYNSGMGGEQNGFVYIKLGAGVTKRIPVTVTIESVPTIAGQTAASTGYQAFPYTSSLSPQCFYGMQQYGSEISTEGLDANGLPTDITVLVNPVTGYGHYKRELPVNRVVSCKWKDKPTGAKALNNCQSPFEIEIQRDPASEKDDISDEGTITAYVSGAQKPVEISVTIQQDDFQPGVIQLMTTTDNGDEAHYDYSCEDCKCKSTVSGVKCVKDEITAKADKNTATTTKHYLEITDKAQYSIHKIPVYFGRAVGLVKNPAKTDAAGNDWDYSVTAGAVITFTGFGTAPDCGTLAAEKDCTKALMKVTNTNGDYEFYPEGEFAKRKTPIKIKVTGGTGKLTATGRTDAEGKPIFTNDVGQEVVEKTVGTYGTPATPSAAGKQCKLQKKGFADNFVGICQAAKPAEANAKYYQLIGPMPGNAESCGLKVGAQWAVAGECKTACTDGSEYSIFDINAVGLNQDYKSVVCEEINKKCCFGREAWDHTQSSLAWDYVETSPYSKCGTSEYCAEEKKAAAAATQNAWFASMTVQTSTSVDNPAVFRVTYTAAADICLQAATAANKKQLRVVFVENGRQLSQPAVTYDASVQTNYNARAGYYFYALPSEALKELGPGEYSLYLELLDENGKQLGQKWFRDNPLTVYPPTNNLGDYEKSAYIREAVMHDGTYQEIVLVKGDGRFTNENLGDYSFELMDVGSAGVLEFTFQSFFDTGSAIVSVRYKGQLHDCGAYFADRTVIAKGSMTVCADNAPAIVNENTYQMGGKKVALLLVRVK